MTVDELNRQLKLMLIPGYGTLEMLKTAARAWFQLYQNAKQTDPSILPSDLRAQRNSLVEQGDSIVGRLQTFGIGIDWLNNSGLGALHGTLITAAAMVAVAGILLYWLNDYIQFASVLSARRDEFNRLVATGMSPEQAAATVQVAFNREAGFLSRLGQSMGSMIPIAIIAGVFMLFKFRKKR